MKKSMITLLACIFAISAYGQTIVVHGVDITDVRLTPSGDEVSVSFTANVGRKAVRSDYELFLTPTLTDGHKQVALPGIVVQGRRATISAARRKRSQGQDPLYDKTVVTSNGRRVAYQALVPYQAWMEGGELQMGETLRGCCTQSEPHFSTLARNLSIKPVPVVVETIPESLPEVSPAIIPPTTGERLAVTLPFIVPSEDYQQYPKDKDLYVDNNREGALAVYFKQSSLSVDMAYRDNRHSFDWLIEAVNEIQDSGDSRVVRVVIVGFASPEGGSAVNNRLAEQRAATAKRLLVENTSLQANRVEIHNGGVDWHGLRAMIAESDMPDRQRVLDIIDTTPVWDVRRNVGRLGELMRLSGGEPYRYMFRNFFPELRNATYIRVYFENK